MTTVSELFPQSAIKSIQEGVLVGATNLSGSGEDKKYHDITISAVDTSKSIAFFEGSTSSTLYPGLYYGNSTYAIGVVQARLTSSTNLRLSTASGSNMTTITGRWKVVEYA